MQAATKAIKVWKKKQDMDQTTQQYVSDMADNIDDVRSVYCMALPSDQLMFNIMRACIGVEDVRDLFCYQKENVVYNH